MYVIKLDICSRASRRPFKPSTLRATAAGEKSSRLSKLTSTLRLPSPVRVLGKGEEKRGGRGERKRGEEREEKGEGEEERGRREERENGIGTIKKVKFGNKRFIIMAN